jgi:hypothetical protein
MSVVISPLILTNAQSFQRMSDEGSGPCLDVSGFGNIACQGRTETWDFLGVKIALVELTDHPSLEHVVLMRHLYRAASCILSLG